MQNLSNRRATRPDAEPSQTPLWVAIVGLLIVMFSRAMQEETIGDVVAWVGAAFTVMGLFYHFVRPRHGL